MVTKVVCLAIGLGMVPGCEIQSVKDTTGFVIAVLSGRYICINWSEKYQFDTL